MASKPIERRYVIGYALAPKKQSSFIQLSLIDLARQRGIDLIKIEPSKPLIEQGPFDCILHKLYGHDWEKQLINYSSNFPNAVIIDCPESIKRLHNRISMLQVVSELEIDCRLRESFGIPKQFVINDVEELSDVRIEREGLKFPVIAKPLVADGSAKSHKMSLVYNDVGLNELKVKPPIVLQEFVNHGGVIFKVYVVGGYVKCVKRKSLADINEENLGSFEGAVSFCQVSNVSSSEKTDHEEYHKLMDLKDIELPPLSLITDIARGLKKATKLHLFNFDVIRDTKVGDRYLVIDINYFPGYAKMPDYERVMTDFFWDVLSKDRRGGVGCFKKPESCDKEVRLLGSSGCSEDGGMVLPVSPLKRDEKEASIQV